MGLFRAANTGITGSIPPTGKISKKEVLTISPKDYLGAIEKYNPFYKERIVGKKEFAWHHFPQSLWKKDVPTFACLDQDWDVLLDQEPVKWKDFPGIFYTQIPMATKDVPIYARVGDLFVQILSFLSFILLGLQLFSDKKFAPA
jgi:hypothetical protein